MPQKSELAFEYLSHQLENIDLTVIPYEGDVEVYANIGSPVINLEKAMFVMKTKGLKRVTVSEKFLKEIHAQTTVKNYGSEIRHCI